MTPTQILTRSLEKYAQPVSPPVSPPGSSASGTYPGMTIQDADARARQQMWKSVTGMFGGAKPAPAATPSTPLVSQPAPRLASAPTPQPTAPATSFATTVSGPQALPSPATPAAPQPTAPTAANWRAPSIIPDASVTSGNSAVATPPTTSNQPSTGEVLKHLVGWGDRDSTLLQTAQQGVNAVGGAIQSGANAVNDARLSAGKAIGENVIHPIAKKINDASLTDPAQRKAQFDSVSTQLNDSKIPVPQRQAFAKDFVAQHLQQNPELAQGMKDFQAGKKTAESIAYQRQLRQSQDEYVQQQVKQQAAEAVKQNPAVAQNPQSFGQMMSGFAQNAMDSFNNMPMPMKLMMGIGLPLGLIGVMSSLFGEGGMGMGLMGVLGLGAAGLAGAGGGMFGQGAQTAVSDGLFNLGQATGMIPKVDPKDLAILKEQDPLAAMGKQPVGTREEVAARLAQVPGQIESLRRLQMLPEGMRARFLQRMDPSMTPEQAQLAVQNAGTILNAYDNPQSQLRTDINAGQDYAQSTGALGWLKEKGAPLYNWWNNKTGADMNIATKLAYQHMTLKAARCWAGYEPVPGAKAYSRGSCRPVGSKKTQKEMKSGKERHHETTKQGCTQG